MPEKVTLLRVNAAAGLPGALPAEDRSSVDGGASMSTGSTVGTGGFSAVSRESVSERVNTAPVSSSGGQKTFDAGYRFGQAMKGLFAGKPKPPKLAVAASTRTPAKAKGAGLFTGSTKYLIILVVLVGAGYGATRILPMVRPFLDPILGPSEQAAEGPPGGRGSASTGTADDGPTRQLLGLMKARNHLAEDVLGALNATQNWSSVLIAEDGTVMIDAPSAPAIEATVNALSHVASLGQLERVEADPQFGVVAFKGRVKSSPEPGELHLPPPPAPGTAQQMNTGAAAAFASHGLKLAQSAVLPSKSDPLATREFVWMTGSGTIEGVVEAMKQVRGKLPTAVAGPIALRRVGNEVDVAMTITLFSVRTPEAAQASTPPFEHAIEGARASGANAGGESASGAKGGSESASGAKGGSENASGEKAAAKKGGY